MNDKPETNRGWRWIRRILIALAILVTLAAIFYTEEEWRGKRAWDNYKRELEAKGVVMDWNAYIPPPVPDDQNFFKAPKMTEWFQKNAPKITQTPTLLKPITNELTRDLDVSKFMDQHQPAKAPVTVAELTIETKITVARTNVVLQFDDPSIGNKVERLIQKIVGPNVNGAQGLVFTAKPLNEIQAAQIILQADRLPRVEEVAAFFSTGTVATNVGSLKIEAGATANSFRVLLIPRGSYSASDYLQWSDNAVPDFNLIREALKRPYARMDGDYSMPYEIPIPNFIAIRAMAQTLAQRAQCYFLLNQPDKALDELTLMHDLRGVMQPPPSDKPITLVAAMINVAVAGLYANVVEESFQKNVWQEPQLAVLQKQLADTDVIPWVLNAFQTEPAAESRDAEIIPTYRWFNLGRDQKPAWETKIGWWFWPHGWTYQNMITMVLLDEKHLDGFDITNEIVDPRLNESAFNEIAKSLSRKSPYKVLASIAVPNFLKATQVTVHNQTMVNEAQIACALERYHIASGNYPETLDALSPQFMEKIPHDIIGGGQLIYRRTGDGKFLLYSVGWNETDDGGVDSSEIKNASSQFTEGDWVWKN